MARFLVAALVLSLLIFAGGSAVSEQADAAATPRNIPWDCSDWQTAAAVADAADERVSVILETLAANRGKTLYCGVDQSDTFTKAETWLAGKDRNERDDTVYYGANGRFRGFLAAQEGYLTDGESGVTGISRARIFEFPEEPRKKRRKKPKRNFELCPGDISSDSDSRIPPYPACVVQTGFHDTAGQSGSDQTAAYLASTNPWSLDLSGRPDAVDTAAKLTAWFMVANRQADADDAARRGCRARRARLVGQAIIQVASEGSPTAVDAWYYSDNLAADPTMYEYRAGRQIYFRATCRG